MATLNWIGKEAVVNHDKEVPFKLLKKINSASVGEHSQNLIVHGDNLEALKALMPHYVGKVKCIYIDPPYNTGNEGWVYNDKVNSPKIKEWLGKVVGTESEDLTRHDKWLCMMYPRLVLLRDLLADEGVIFVSIDQNELHHLRLLMNEIFDERNFVEIFSWMKTSTPPGLSAKSRKTTEYVLCFEKRKSNKRYKGELLEGGDQPLLNSGNKYRILRIPKESVVFNFNGIYSVGQYERIDLKEDIIIDNNQSQVDLVLGGEFKWTQETLDEEVKSGTVFIVKTDKFAIRFIRQDEGKYKAPTNLIKDRYITSLINKESGVGTNESASSELEDLFGKRVFEYSKPASLIKFLINLSTGPNDWVLDSFAGSGTTGHAVMDLNKDGGNRKFILVEMEGKVAKDITAERIKRAIKKYDYKDGFEYCELDKPLFDKDGQIEESCDFKQFATYIYFTETQTNIDAKQVNGNYIGESTDVEYYLLYKSRGKNDLDKSALKMLRDTGKKKVIYADRCMLDESDFARYNITFKQIPYEVKVY